MKSNGEFHIPLLALVGTAAVGVVYFIKEHTRRDIGRENDYMSVLPNEILCQIISYLDMKDAVRTSILSRRWRQLYCTLPNLMFDYHEMYKETSFHKIFDFVTRMASRYCHCYKLRFVADVDKFLQLRSGIPVKSFTLKFCMMKEFHVHLERWLTFIVRFGVRDVNLCFECHCDIDVNYIVEDKLQVVPFNILLSARMLENVNLRNCRLEPKFQGLSNSLKNLTLRFVPLLNGEVESILSSCPQLRFLELRFCKLANKLFVKSVELRKLVIVHSEQAYEIGFFAPNLEIFSHLCNPGCSFLPSHVPNLRLLGLDFVRLDRPYGFVSFIRSAPCLHSLCIRGSVFQVQKLQIKMPTLSAQNLGRLILHVDKGSLNLRYIISMIAVYPNLSHFELSTLKCSLSYEETNAEVLPTFVHLCSVLLDGFKFVTAQKKFVSQILRCAPALEIIRIHTAYSFHYVGRRLEKTLPWNRRVFSDELISSTKQQLEQEASSPSLVIKFY